jgi:hypothetical protein
MGPRAMQRIRNFRRMKQKKLKKCAKDERVGTEKFSMEEEDEEVEDETKKNRIKIKGKEDRKESKKRGWVEKEDVDGSKEGGQACGTYMSAACQRKGNDKTRGFKDMSTLQP